ncbi:ferrous iron transport protein B [Coprococcus catus]|uniref:Ferrous iron transport protein B n=1 Tax=Coprococcus catus TaxID=116085 RepID=A0A3E2TTA8_9FIRM|nr:ferrous iron transport protein B [Coprococcus catus]
MAIRIALAGNPNCGKTTLFNALTGSNQFVGNWPGVTVEKKEGKLKGHKDVVITDLPGIYSLSPYTLEEVVARNYILNEKPDAILNIVDGTNLERNLYLTTQLMELGIPVIMAINMMDLVQKNGDNINIQKLSEVCGCPVYEISALKNTGIKEASDAVVKAAQSKAVQGTVHKFNNKVEGYLNDIETLLGSDVADAQKRFYAIKLFERDDKIAAQMKSAPNVEAIISKAEKEMDDDSESIITNERYEYIASIIGSCLKKKHAGADTISDKIDRIVTNRILALPIFAVIMFLVYYISMTTIGAAATGWTNDNLFGDGFFIGSDGGYGDADEAYAGALEVVNGFISYEADQGMDTSAVEAAIDSEADDYDPAAAAAAVNAFVAQVDPSTEATYLVEDEETLATEETTASYADLTDAVAALSEAGYEAPDPAAYGTFISSIPDAVSGLLENANCAEWLQGLIVDGIIAGVGAVLGFVPQMLVLFFLLAILESCGYMARIAFIMDRIFRKFGLSGKSFIPILVGTGCGIPGIMASRTIENERDRRMTIMTTTFIPCGAKTPFIAMIAGAVFGGAAWVATSAYFLGMAAIICSGIILKKTKIFAGDPAPFVMELPAYHIPTPGAVLRATWERGWSFIKKAGTIITLSTILVWFLSYFGWVDGAFTMLAEDQLDSSILARVGHAIAWIFAPLGFGNWQATVASVTGLVAKENIVGTLGILYGGGDGTVYQTMAASFTLVSGYAFMAFNLLCAPCFAAMGAIKREMNNAKWFWIAIGYQCGFAYLVALVINQIGNLVANHTFGIFTVVAILVIIGFFYLLFRPYKESNTLEVKGKAVA